MASQIQIDLTKFKDIHQSEIITIDFSLYFIIIIMCILTFSFIMYLLMKKKNVKLTKEELISQKLKNISLDDIDTKKVIYDFTIYGKESLNLKYKDEFEEILLELEPYKYIKEDKKLTNILIKKMQDYIKVTEQCKH